MYTFDDHPYVYMVINDIESVHVFTTLIILVSFMRLDLNESNSLFASQTILTAGC